jgi:hypothetical protein
MLMAAVSNRVSHNPTAKTHAYSKGKVMVPEATSTAITTKSAARPIGRDHCAKPVASIDDDSRNQGEQQPRETNRDGGRRHANRFPSEASGQQGQGGDNDPVSKIRDRGRGPHRPETPAEPHRLTSPWVSDHIPRYGRRC